MVTIIRFETGSPCLKTNNPFLLSHHILHCLMTTETSQRDSRASYTMSEQLLLYILKMIVEMMHLTTTIVLGVKEEK